MPSRNVEQPLLAALDAHYEVLGATGRDSDPVILLARERVTSSWVALRILECAFGEGPEIAERLAGGIAAAARLRHTQIARVERLAGVSADAIAIATEYVPGRSVRAVLREVGRLPPGDVERVLRSAAAGLEYAHRGGVVHGSIATRNIIVEDTTGRVVLAGFGETLAAAPPRPNDGPTVEGPAPVVAAADGAKAGVAADLLALGRVGWEMLTGAPPGEDEDLGGELSSLILGGAVRGSRLPPGTPLRIVLALEGALQRDPARRWSSAAAFLHQLAQDEALPETHRRHGRGAGLARFRRGGDTRLGRAAAAGELAEPPAVRSPSRRPPRVILPAESTTAQVTPPPVRQWGTARVVALPVVLLSAGAIALASRNPAVLRSIARFPAAASPAARTQLRVSAARVAQPIGRGVSGPASRDAPRGRAPSGAGVAAAAPALSTSRAAVPAKPVAMTPPASAASAPRVGGAADVPELEYAPSRLAARGHSVRATDLLGLRTPSDARAAIDEYLMASRLDSSSATIRAGLAQAYAVVLERGWYDSPEAVARATDRGLAAAAEALRLDPRSEPAWVARGSLLTFRNPRSLDEAFRSYRQALALVPDDAEALRLAARASEYVGDFDGAAATYERALSHAPNDAAVLSGLAELAYLRHRFDEARRLTTRAIAADPHHPDAYVLDVRMRLRTGDLRDAWTDAEMAQRLGYPIPGAAAGLLVYAQMPDSTETRARVDSLVRDVRARRAALPVLDSRYLALALVAIGRRDVALDALERAYPRGAALWLALQDPGFQSLHGQPRFERLVEASRATGRRRG